MSVRTHEYSFFIFHLMLALGFGTVFIFSWRDR
jgi:hypothetical protein